MHEGLIDLLRGNLSTEARVWTAAAPAVLLVLAVVCAMLAFTVHDQLRGPYRDAEVERRGSTWLLGMWLRRCFSWTMRPFIALLIKTRLPPAALTTLALL